MNFGPVYIFRNQVLGYQDHWIGNCLGVKDGEYGKGGSEATVKIAKADLVPTDHNLRDQYADWQALEQACQEFMADVNTRPHRSTRQPPVAHPATQRRTMEPAGICRFVLALGF